MRAISKGDGIIIVAGIQTSVLIAAICTSFGLTMEKKMPGRNELREELKALKSEKLALDKGWIPMRDKARKVDEKIKETMTALRIVDLSPRVSDHALFRYLQRKYAVDFDGLREEILTEKVKAAIKAGASAITVDGYKYIITEGCITTILGKDQSILSKRTMRERRDDYKNEALLTQQEECMPICLTLKETKC